MKFKVNLLALYRIYRKWVKFRKGVRIIKKGCPKCKGNLEVTNLFKMCENFGKGCDFILIKGRYVLEKKTTGSGKQKQNDSAIRDK